MSTSVHSSRALAGALVDGLVGLVGALVGAFVEALVRALFDAFVHALVDALTDAFIDPLAPPPRAKAQRLTRHAERSAQRTPSTQWPTPNARSPAQQADAAAELKLQSAVLPSGDFGAWDAPDALERQPTLPAPTMRLLAHRLMTKVLLTGQQALKQQMHSRPPPGHPMQEALLCER